MFTSNVVGYTKSNGVMLVTVEYTNGVDTYSFVSTVSTMDQLNQEIQNRINQLNDAANLENELASPSLKTTPTTVTTIQTPTPEDTFAQNVADLKSMNSAISLGVLLNTDTNYLTLQASVEKDLSANPSWIKYF